jgi:hypothetical protein
VDDIAADTERWRRKWHGLCVDGSWKEFTGPPQEKDRVVNKYRASGFMETDLTPRARKCRPFSWAAWEFSGFFDTARDAIAKIITCFSGRLRRGREASGKIDADRPFPALPGRRGNVT